MFINLTHAESQRTISVKVESINAVDADKESTIVMAGAMRLHVKESRKQVLELIENNKKENSRGNKKNVQG